MPYLFLFIFYIIPGAYLIATQKNYDSLLISLFALSLGVGLAYLYRYKSNPKLKNILLKFM